LKAPGSKVTVIGSVAAAVALGLVALLARQVAHRALLLNEGQPSPPAAAQTLVVSELVLVKSDANKQATEVAADAGGPAALLPTLAASAAPAGVELPVPRPGLPTQQPPPLSAAEKLAAQAEAYARAGKLGLARAAAKDALAEDEMNALAYQVLGDCAFVSHDVDDALFHWERGLRRNPDHGVLHGRVEFGKTERGTLAGMRHLKNEHFVVAHDAAEEAGAKATVRTLEAAREHVGRFYDFYPTDSVPVVLYPRDKFYARGNQTNWATADYDGRIRIGSDTAESQMLLFRQILYHEYAHAVLDRATQGCTVPGWFNEGFAQFIQNQLAAPTILSCAGAHGFPLMRLEGSFGAFASPGLARAAYLTSLHAAEKLTARFGEDGVRRLIKTLSKRCNFERAFQESFGTSYRDFATQFDNERP
jgi:tetratricopeptide (TPR) repeat protein